VNDPSKLWTDLCGVLEPRRPRGWRQVEEQKKWCFGLGGTSLLVADIADGESFVTVLEYLADVEHHYVSTRALLDALPALECRYRGLAALQSEILESDIGLKSAGLVALLKELAAQDNAFDS